MADTILLRGGNKAGMPQLNDREAAFCRDEKALYVGTPEGNVKLCTAFTEEKVARLETDKLTAKKAAAVAAVAYGADAAAIVSAFNGLLAAMKAAGLMEN